MGLPLLPVFLDFFRVIKDEPLERFHDEFYQAVQYRLTARPHGRADDWDQVIGSLPALKQCWPDFASPTINLTSSDNIDLTTLETALRQLHPWRKGPFNIFGIVVDSEWRSDWKWPRLAERIQPLQGKAALDIGCGNGYYLYRMLGAGARLALGIDPTRLFCYQFQALQLLQPKNQAAMLPLLDEDLPVTECFDTVFSMGVLYHRKQPESHLDICFKALSPGGELVLETLIIDNPEVCALQPKDRYAKMRNVWELPSLPKLSSQLEDAGFEDLKIIDITRTTTLEQRATGWMQFQSLADFLDPLNPNLTIEGHPAPLRAIIAARRP